MTESSEGPKGPRTFADKIFGINPYSKDDPNHEKWESNARLTAEEEARFESELLKRIPETPEESARYVQDGMIGHFDILASRLLVFKFRSAESIALYEEGIAKMMESMIKRADECCPPSIPKSPFLFELRRQFRQRIAHWTAEALKRMREGMATDRVSEGAASGEPGLSPGVQGVGTITQSAEQVPDNAMADTNADTTGRSRKRHRVRGPDWRKHQERVAFEDVLIQELGTVRDRQNSATTLEELRANFPAFKLWTILSPAEQRELLVEEFRPRAWARKLTIRKFGVGEEAVKKSRQILKRDTPHD